MCVCVCVLVFSYKKGGVILLSSIHYILEITVMIQIFFKRAKTSVCEMLIKISAYWKFSEF